MIGSKEASGGLGRVGSWPGDKARLTPIIAACTE